MKIMFLHFTTKDVLKLLMMDVEQENCENVYSGMFEWIEKWATQTYKKRDVS